MPTFSRETPGPLEPWYVTGLVEAQGSFTFSRTTAGANLYFAFPQGGTDEQLVRDLQDFFQGAGRIYPVRGRRAAYYRITRLEELPIVADHFEAHPLRGPKGAAFRIWRDMLRCKLEQFRKAPREELERLARELSRANSRQAGT